MSAADIRQQQRRKLQDHLQPPDETDSTRGHQNLQQYASGSSSSFPHYGYNNTGSVRHGSQDQYGSYPASNVLPMPNYQDEQSQPYKQQAGWSQHPTQVGQYEPSSASSSRDQQYWDNGTSVHSHSHSQAEPYAESSRSAGGVYNTGAARSSHGHRQAQITSASYGSPTSAHSRTSQRADPSDPSLPSVEQVHMYLVDHMKQGKGLQTGWTIRNKPLDVYELFSKVQRAGGSTLVGRKNEWDSIAADLGFPSHGIAMKLRDFFVAMLGGLEVMWEQTKSARDRPPSAAASASSVDHNAGQASQYTPPIQSSRSTGTGSTQSKAKSRYQDQNQSQTIAQPPPTPPTALSNPGVYHWTDLNNLASQRHPTMLTPQRRPSWDSSPAANLSTMANAASTSVSSAAKRGPMSSSTSQHGMQSNASSQAQWSETPQYVDPRLTVHASRLQADTQGRARLVQSQQYGSSAGADAYQSVSAGSDYQSSAAEEQSPAMGQDASLLSETGPSDAAVALSGLTETEVPESQKRGKKQRPPFLHPPMLIPRGRQPKEPYLVYSSIMEGPILLADARHPAIPPNGSQSVLTPTSAAPFSYIHPPMRPPSHRPPGNLMVKASVMATAVPYGSLERRAQIRTVSPGPEGYTYLHPPLLLPRGRPTTVSQKIKTSTMDQPIIIIPAPVHASDQGSKENTPITAIDGENASTPGSSAQSRDPLTTGGTASTSTAKVAPDATPTANPAAAGSNTTGAADMSSHAKKRGRPPKSEDQYLPAVSSEGQSAAAIARYTTAVSVINFSATPKKVISLVSSVGKKSKAGIRVKDQTPTQLWTPPASVLVTRPGAPTPPASAGAEEDAEGELDSFAQPATLSEALQAFQDDAEMLRGVLTDEGDDEDGLIPPGVQPPVDPPPRETKSIGKKKGKARASLDSQDNKPERLSATEVDNRGRIEHADTPSASPKKNRSRLTVEIPRHGSERDRIIDPVAGPSRPAKGSATRAQPAASQAQKRATRSDPVPLSPAISPAPVLAKKAAPAAASKTSREDLKALPRTTRHGPHRSPAPGSVLSSNRPTDARLQHLRRKAASTAGGTFSSTSRTEQGRAKRKAESQEIPEDVGPPATRRRIDEPRTVGGASEANRVVARRRVMHKAGIRIRRPALRARVPTPLPPRAAKKVYAAPVLGRMAKRTKQQPPPPAPKPPTSAKPLAQAKTTSATQPKRQRSGPSFKIVLPIGRRRRDLLIKRGWYDPLRDDDSEDEEDVNQEAETSLPHDRPEAPTTTLRFARAQTPDQPVFRFLVRPGPAVLEPFASILTEQNLLKTVSERRCRWRGCDAVLASEDLLKRHIRFREHALQGQYQAINEDEEEDFFYRCYWQGCEGPSFRTTGSLEQHMYARHTSKVLICPFPHCGLSSTNISHLTRHVVRQHGDDPFSAAPLADLSEKLPLTQEVPSEPLPPTARADEVMNSLVRGSAYHSSFRRDHLRQKVKQMCFAGPNPVIHVEHPPHMLEKVEGAISIANSDEEDEIVQPKKTKAILKAEVKAARNARRAQLEKEKKWTWWIEIPKRKIKKRVERPQVQSAVLVRGHSYPDLVIYPSIPRSGHDDEAKDERPSANEEYPGLSDSHPAVSEPQAAEVFQEGEAALMEVDGSEEAYDPGIIGELADNGLDRDEEEDGDEEGHAGDTYDVFGDDAGDSFALPDDSYVPDHDEFVHMEEADMVDPLKLYGAIFQLPAEGEDGGDLEEEIMNEVEDDADSGLVDVAEASAEVMGGV